MAVEDADFIGGLNFVLPQAADAISEGDNHIRLIKKVLKQTFDGVNAPFSAAHIKRGVLDPARVPNLDGAKITTGTIPKARFPAGLTRTELYYDQDGHPVADDNPVQLDLNDDLVNYKYLQFLMSHNGATFRCSYSFDIITANLPNAKIANSKFNWWVLTGADDPEIQVGHIWKFRKDAIALQTSANSATQLHAIIGSNI